MIRIKVLVGRIAAFFMVVYGAAAIPQQVIDAKFAAMGDYQPEPGQPFTEEDFASFLKDLVADILLEDVQIDQLEALTPLFLYHADTRRRMISRLDELQGDRGIEGARAAVMELALKVRGAEPAGMALVVGETLAHPGIREDIRAGRGSDLFSILRGLPREALDPNAEAIAGLSEAFDPSMSRRALAISTDYPVVVSELAHILGEERVAGIVARFEHLMALEVPSGTAPDKDCKKTDMQDDGGMVHHIDQQYGE